ncbi:hypothetical protein RF11_03791 [Thelohanellus kitauei]|uniref:Uncharacterized protein n=1 Tax=Thelohanellus kitauei TaxID=669202 RepID=A0A0C2MNR5_THEKT|nr:hypothetical protein RF11_03791 [Thelohanellus kitauei]
MEYVIPHNLEYDFTRKVLKWKADSPPCLPLMECFHGEELFARNFSDINFVKLDLRFGDVCRVATCPQSVFNISCSPFSQHLKIGIISNFQRNLIIISSSVVAVIILICVLLFLICRKCFRIKSIEQLTIQNLTFRSLLKKENNKFFHRIQSVESHGG